MSKYTKEKWLFLIVLAISIVLIIAGNQRRGVSGDFRIAIVNDEGIYLRTISSSRRMVNMMDIDRDTEVWIPEGLGWYRAGTVKKILTSEKKIGLIQKVLFYNFGFVPHVVEYGPTDKWLLEPRVSLRWGVLNYLKFRVNEESMMTKQDDVRGVLTQKTDFLNEVLPRDFADSEILKEDLKVSVYNQSEMSGLAALVARNLEWSGLAIIGVDNYLGQVEKCQVTHGNQVKDLLGFGIIKRIFDGCRFEEKNELAPTDVEITLGNGFAQMLNYGSYTIN